MARACRATLALISSDSHATLKKHDGELTIAVVAGFRPERRAVTPARRPVVRTAFTILSKIQLLERREIQARRRGACSQPRAGFSPLRLSAP